MRFGILGPLLVTDGDREIDPGPPRNRAVLAHLVVHADRVVDIDWLIEQVWGGQAGAGTTSSLHVTMSRLRKQLRPADGSPSPIVTQAPGYRLAVGRADVDALLFADLVDRARKLVADAQVDRARQQLDDALGLWRGRPLADIRTEAAQAEAARLDAQWLAAVELSAELDLALGRHGEMSWRLAEVAAENRLRESLQGALITALYRQGRQAEALDVYDRTRQVLADELGIDPGPELQRLHAQVLAHDPALDWSPPRPAVAVEPPAAPAAATPAAGPARIPLLGRDAEWARAAALLDGCRAGDTGALALFGESGIGKTRLAEEVADHARRSGFDVAWGRCQDGGGTPAFWPWTQALQSLAAARSAEQVAAATAGRGAHAAAMLTGVPAAPVGVAGTPRVQLFDSVAAAVALLAADRPVCLVLEDLQWADADSVDLLDYLLSSVEGVPLLVVLTVRDPDEAPHSEGRRVLAATTRQRRTERVHLSGLDPDAVRLYSSAHLGTEVSEAAAGRLRERTSGNPFFIGELVRLFADEKSGAQRAGTQDADGTPVPASVQAVLERRYRHLAASTRQVLAASAVIGRTVDVRTIAEVLGRSPLELADDLDEAVGRGVLVGDPLHPGRYSFSHALVREALLAATGPMRRATLHVQVAEVLERSLAEDADGAAALAYHLRSAGSVGDLDKAARYSLLAASTARRRSAPREAERHCRDALAVLAGRSGPVAAQLERDARRQLAGLVTMTLGYDTSAVALQRQRRAEVPGERAEALPKLTGGVAVALASNDLPAAELLVSEMEEAARRWDDATLRLSAHHARGQVLVLRGRLREGLERFTAAGRLLDEAAEDIDFSLFVQNPRASAPAWQGLALALMGDVPASDAAAGTARRAARERDEPYTTAMIHYLESWRALFLDRPAEIVARSTAAIEGAGPLGLPKLAALAGHPLGAGLARLGRVTEGLAAIRGAHATLQEVAPGDLLSHLLLGMIAEVEALAGLDDDAERTARRALSEGVRTGERVYQPAVHLLLAQISRRRGAPAGQTRTLLEAGLAVAADQEAGIFGARLQAELDRLG